MADYLTFQTEVATVDREVRPRFFGACATLVFVTKGMLVYGQDNTEQTAPALFFWPETPDITPVLKAGSEAHVLGMSDEVLLDAIGARSESVHLRMLVDDHFFAVVPDPWLVDQVKTLFGWFDFEVNGPERTSPMAQAAMLRLLLIGALRMHDPDKNKAQIESRGLLREFRHLVELHYRKHWKMADYTASLGVQYDRLHDVCTNETGRSPAELVHERLTAEAKARLERTGVPLKKIASDLGFSDASRFSHFFKRRTGVAPGMYRSVTTRRLDEEFDTFHRNFIEWP